MVFWPAHRLKERILTACDQFEDMVWMVASVAAREWRAR